MNAIKLNPSQTLWLVKERERFFTGSSRGAAVDKGAAGLGAEQESIFFLSPLLCLPQEDFSREDFLSIKRLSAYGIREADGTFFFPCRIEFARGETLAPLPCALRYRRGLSLAAFFRDAARLATDGGNLCGAWEGLGAEKPLFLPTSFKLCRAEFTNNAWRLYDEVWKKTRR